jgi:hypothetical protein
MRRLIIAGEQHVEAAPGHDKQDDDRRKQQNIHDG